MTDRATFDPAEQARWEAMPPLRKVIHGLEPLCPADDDMTEGVFVEATEPIPTFWAVVDGNLYQLPRSEARIRTDLWRAAA